MKKILVTGGAGFIGSHLCERLVSKDTEVFSLDNYSTGSKNNHVEGVKYIKGETSNIDSIIDFIPNEIYHLGEYSRVEQSFSDIDSVIQSNKIGTCMVLEFCRKNNVKLIYAGSSTKFGDNGLNKKESPYAWSKYSNSELIANYGDWYSLNYVIVYFYNAYGPREISQGKYSTVIGLFAQKMKNNQPLTVVSPGTQRRNFTHVKDIVSGLILAAEKGYGDGYGIGNSESFSIIEIAKLFGGNIEMLPERKGNRLTAEVMNKKISDLGWSPTVSINEYINQIKSKNWEI